MKWGAEEFLALWALFRLAPLMVDTKVKGFDWTYVSRVDSCCWMLAKHHVFHDVGRAQSDVVYPRLQSRPVLNGQ
jgi:hypothetical protein